MRLHVQGIYSILKYLPIIEPTKSFKSSSNPIKLLFLVNFFNVHGSPICDRLHTISLLDCWKCGCRCLPNKNVLNGEPKVTRYKMLGSQTHRNFSICMVFSVYDDEFKNQAFIPFETLMDKFRVQLFIMDWNGWTELTKSKLDRLWGVELELSFNKAW